MGRAQSKAEWTAAPFVPTTTSLRALADAARSCKGCPLWQPAVQTVFGEGKRAAALMLVGEQPGDKEDVQGHPFVGPAGRVLWKCIEAADISQDDVFVTNAVKHFKHEERGKRRIHKKPNAAEVEACHPWLDAELRSIAPAVVVALGATAAASLLGRTVPIAASRGQRFDVDGHPTVVTYHPSAVLRADERAAEIREALITDLRRASELATSH